MLKAAHKHSIYNRDEIERGSKAGCFNCIKVFLVSSITDWTDDDTTALCPRCGIDSMIGEASGFKLTRSFLEDMYLAYFSLTGKRSDLLEDFPQRKAGR